MTKLQYLALRTVFSAEIARREDRDLARIIKTLVDDPIEQRIRERRAQEQDGEAVADNAPVNTDGGNVADNAATEKRKPSAATLKASKTAATGKPALSTAMQALAVITGALASGAAAGIIIHKRHGRSAPAAQWVTMTVADLTAILTSQEGTTP